MDDDDDEVNRSTIVEFKIRIEVIRRIKLLVKLVSKEIILNLDFQAAKEKIYLVTIKKVNNFRTL